MTDMFDLGDVSYQGDFSRFRELDTLKKYFEASCPNIHRATIKDVFREAFHLCYGPNCEEDAVKVIDADLEEFRYRSGYKDEYILPNYILEANLALRSHK